MHIAAAAAAVAVVAVAVALLDRCSTVLVAPYDFVFFLSFFPFLCLCFCDCSGGCTSRSSSHLCGSQEWSIFNTDPPRISPPHHVPFRCMYCLVCSTDDLCLELLNPVHESRLLVGLRPHSVMILITLSFLQCFATFPLDPHGRTYMGTLEFRHFLRALSFSFLLSFLCLLHSSFHSANS